MLLTIETRNLVDAVIENMYSDTTFNQKLIYVRFKTYF